MSLNGLSSCIIYLYLCLFLSGNFQAGESGTILKKLCPKEYKCLTKLMTDVLRPYIPEYRGDIAKDDESILYL